jgi:anaerobic selenocysteine-containing dehydrogenase
MAICNSQEFAGPERRGLARVCRVPRSMQRPGTCTLCDATCGILVDVDGDRVVGVRGDPDDPISRGYVCPKVVAMQDLHHDPDRLRRPLVREGTTFREASWDEAIAIAGDGLARVRKQHGKDALAIYQGNPTAHNLGLMTVGQLALRTLGTKNMYSAATTDTVPHMRAAHEMFGSVLYMPVADLDRTDVLLCVGANPIVSNGSVMTAPDVKRRLRELKARGGKLLVVDPRRTETAAVADEHTFLRPGTDALFFFALLHVVFAENLIDPARRIEPWLAGEAELRELAARFSPERVADATGVAPEAVRTIARTFATARRAACHIRVGTCHQEHATLVSWLAWSLAAVTGNLDREGGLMWSTPAADVPGFASRIKVGGHGKFTSRVRKLPETNDELPIATLADEIETPGNGRVRALLTSAGNPALSAPNGARLERALASLDFMVSIDHYLNETTRLANVILPPCSALQRPHYDLALNVFSVENSAKWVDPIVQRAPDDREDHEIVTDLVLRLRLGSVLASARPRAFMRAALGRVLSPERIVDLALRTGPYGGSRGGTSVAALRRSPHGVSFGPLVPRLPELLRTPSRRIELAPSAFVAEVDALEATLARATPPFVLIGRRQLRSNNSWLHNSHRLVKGPPRCVLLVHPEDAARLSLRDGGRARVTSNRGEVEVTVAVTGEMMPGVVSLPHGWGHDRKGARTSVAEAHAGVSINDLTDETRLDRLTGSAAFTALPVTITAA